MGIKSEEARNQKRLKLVTFLGGDIPYEKPRIIGGGGRGVTTLTKTRDTRKFRQIFMEPFLIGSGRKSRTPTITAHWQKKDRENREAGIYNS